MTPKQDGDQVVPHPIPIDMIRAACARDAPTDLRREWIRRRAASGVGGKPDRPAQATIGRATLAP